jgi:hypothetical protein
MKNKKTFSFIMLFIVLTLTLPNLTFASGKSYTHTFAKGFTVKSLSSDGLGNQIVMGYGSDQKNVIYAIDVNGVKKWTIQTGVKGPFNVTIGYDNNIYYLNKETLYSYGNGKLRWKKTIKGATNEFAGKGVIQIITPTNVQGYDTNGKLIYNVAYKKEDGPMFDYGKGLWHLIKPGNTNSKTVYYGGKKLFDVTPREGYSTGAIAITKDEKIILMKETVQRVGMKGAVMAVDPKGKMLWRSEVPIENININDIAVLPDGNILYTYFDQMVNISPKGKVNWIKTNEGYAQKYIQVIGNNIYFDGVVYNLSGEVIKRISDSFSKNYYVAGDTAKIFTSKSGFKRVP